MRQLIPQPRCPDRAYARQMIGAFEAFRRAKINKRDPVQDIIEYNATGREHWTPADIVRKAQYGDLSRAFSFLHKPDKMTFREYLLKQHREMVMDTENDEGLAD